VIRNRGGYWQVKVDAGLDPLTGKQRFEYDRAKTKREMLLEAERLAPEAVRYQVIVKEMLRELLRREHQASTPQLRPLAVRVGILREDAS
jgi:hypothetical protein